MASDIVVSDQKRDLGVMVPSSMKTSTQICWGGEKCELHDWD